MCDISRICHQFTLSSESPARELKLLNLFTLNSFRKSSFTSQNTGIAGLTYSHVSKGLSKINPEDTSMLNLVLNRIPSHLLQAFVKCPVREVQEVQEEIILKFRSTIQFSHISYFYIIWDPLVSHIHTKRCLSISYRRAR